MYKKGLMSRSESKQLAINMFAQVLVFAISLCITFFLTPFIVKNLSVEAYGFVGLSNNIIDYMQVITIALNSMAGRFITIEYHKGNLQKANQYFSSVFFANCIFSAIVFAVCMALMWYLEFVISIPANFVFDVKLLFFFLSVNAVLNLVFNVFIVPPFIKNKLEISAMRNLIFTFLRMVLLVVLFSLFVPAIWYLGVTAIACSIYLVIANIIIRNKLTPELHILRKDYEWKYVKEILISGTWNVVNKISVILEKGFDLLLANWFINTFVMGLLSITTQISVLIPKVIGLIASSFAPSITEQFAKGDIEAINRNVFKSIRIMSMLVIMPLSFFYVYGDAFFVLWLPNQDSSLLQTILVLSTIDMIFGMPLEIFWSIFTATNKIKVPALTMLAVGGLTFLTLLILLSVFKDQTAQLICLISTRMIWNTIKNLTFLPIYGAKCLNLQWNFFYRSMTKPMIGIIFTLLICQLARIIYHPNNWIMLILAGLAIVFISMFVGAQFILTKNDKQFILAKLHIIK